MTDESRTDADDDAAAMLAPVVAELRECFLVTPSAEVAQRHLDAMFAAITVAERPDDAAAGHVVAMRARRRWIAGAAAAGALALTSGLAAAGELPAPLQQRVSGVVANVGIHVPTGVDVPQSPDGEHPVDDPAGTNGNPQNDGNGQSEDAPGHGGDAPGQSEDAPGQGGDSPGQSENAPGKGGSDPGNSGNAPDPSTTTTVDDGKTPPSTTPVAPSPPSTTPTPPSTGVTPTTPTLPTPPTTVHNQGSDKK